MPNQQQRTHESVLADIQAHPENHKHDFEGLQQCCLINRAVDLSIMEAHSKYINLGANGGTRCDVTSGPCACGAWH